MNISRISRVRLYVASPRPRVVIVDVSSRIFVQRLFEASLGASYRTFALVHSLFAICLKNISRLDVTFILGNYFRLEVYLIDNKCEERDVHLRPLYFSFRSTTNEIIVMRLKCKTQYQHFSYFRESNFSKTVCHVHRADLHGFIVISRDKINQSRNSIQSNNKDNLASVDRN